MRPASERAATPGVTSTGPSTGPSTTAVITPAHGRHDHLALQQRSLDGQIDHLRVVVAMDDEELAARPDVPASLPTTPDGLPLAAARNRGAELALAAGAHVLVFLDVDVVAAPGCLAAYRDAVDEEPGTLWSGPVTYLDAPPPGGYDLATLPETDSPHPARPAPERGRRVTGADPRLFWSLSFACSDELWLRVGGFCEEYRGYGGEDTDFARLVAQSQGTLGWEGSARGFHQWHPVDSPPVHHLDAILRNSALHARRWGEPAMEGWLDAFARMGLISRTEDGSWRRTGEQRGERPPGGWGRRPA